MLKILFGFWCILFFCFVDKSAAQSAPTPPLKLLEEKLSRLEDAWLSTYVSGDKVKYDEIVADDFTGIDESAVLRGKIEDRALLPAARVPGGSAVNEDIRVRVYGRFAIVTGRIVTKFTVDGREIAGFKTRFTDTWTKRDGGWKVIARHYSRYPPERVSLAYDPAALSELTGKYEIAPGIEYEVSVENAKLLGALAGQPKLELFAESEFVFFTKTPVALYLFSRDRVGKVAQLLFIQDARVTPAKKR